MQGKISTTRPHTAGALGRGFMPLRGNCSCTELSWRSTLTARPVQYSAVSICALPDQHTAFARCTSQKLPCMFTAISAGSLSSSTCRWRMNNVAHKSNPAALRCHAIGGQQAGGGQCSDAERSSMVHEELVYFLFQMEMDVQLARALNYEAYEQAQQVRAKRQQVDEALEALRAKKDAGGEKAEQPLSAADIAAEGLRLRTAMQRAVEAENYKEAAALRDQLASLQAKSAQSEAMAVLVSGRVQPQLRLGQRVWHKRHAYRGVVVGWDGKCCENEEWLSELKKASGGVTPSPDQPYYHLLVDQRDWKYDPAQSPVAYVAEELLWAPDQGGPIPVPVWSKVLRGEVAFISAEAQQQPGTASRTADQAPAPAPPVLEPDSGWADVFGKDDGLEHPYAYMLFLGMDAQGDYLPCRQLRDRYNVARRDVFPSRHDGDEKKDEDNDTGGQHTNEDN